MFQIRKPTSSNKTIRMPDLLIEKMEKLAYQNDISFNQLVIQCCEYALEHTEKEAPETIKEDRAAEKIVKNPGQ